MNTPSTVGKNWKWRMEETDMSEALKKNPANYNIMRKKFSCFYTRIVIKWKH